MTFDILFFGCTPTRIRTRFRTAQIIGIRTRMSGNSSCDSFLDFKQATLAETSTLVRVLGYVGLLLTLVGYPLCWFNFVLARNSLNAERLTKRNLPMITLLVIGYGIIGVTLSISNIVGHENFDCHVFSICSVVSLIFALLSLTLRISAFANRIGFNKGLINSRINELALNGYILPGNSDSITKSSSLGTEVQQKVCCRPQKSLLMIFYRWRKPKNVPEELQFRFFLSSTRFTVVTFILVGSLVLAASLWMLLTVYIPIDLTCFGCTVQTGSDFFYGSIFILMVTMAMLWSLRKYPDSLGVKQEIYIFALITVIIHVLFIEVPSQYIIPFREAEVERRFDFSFFLMLENLAVVFHQLPYQVIVARRLEKTSTRSVTLKEFIQDEAATKAFLLYLSTCLATENLLFYKAAEAWTNDFDSLSEAHRAGRSRGIIIQFIERGAFNRINISGMMATKLVEAVEEGNLSKDMFSAAANEILMLLLPAFNNFFESSYHAALTNSLIDQDLDAIEEGSVF